MFRRRMIPLIAAGGVVLGGTAAALAVNHDARTLSTLDNAKISMQQAITIAQNLTGGKAVRVALGHDYGRYIYRVRMLTKKGTDRVAIDAVTGRVLTVISKVSVANAAP